MDQDDYEKFADEHLKKTAASIDADEAFVNLQVGLSWGLVVLSWFLCVVGVVACAWGELRVSGFLLSVAGGTVAYAGLRLSVARVRVRIDFDVLHRLLNVDREFVEASKRYSRLATEQVAEAERLREEASRQMQEVRSNIVRYAALHGLPDPFPSSTEN
jgi:hypothetical protein